VPLGDPRWDDDDWTAKIELLVDAAPAVCSFAFGCPDRSVVEALQRRGSLVMVTVTSPVEAEAAAAAGADMVCAQGSEAGAHRSTFDDDGPDELLPALALVTAIRERTALPVVAAGGIAEPADVAAALAAGASAVQVGTAFQLCREAGTNEVHRAALRDPAFSETALTRAFTGRRARALVNRFTREHPDAPSAYPEIHHVTRPLRTAAVSRNDPDSLHLWAGTGWRQARDGPAAGIIEWLSSRLA
jgi:nitronate monooxygenase